MVQGDVTGGKRRATRPWRAASLRETVGRAPSHQHGGRAGEGAR
ncbi:DUF6380 family protein [Streptomyces sp. S.PNR 29]|nr:DUF6380 family protein [Streptomyces sp. S.PNR 29]MDN0198670.1 hypothetical protein [Streptomyces sp. S.PNR 29]